MNKEMDEMIKVICEKRKKCKSCKSCKIGNANVALHCPIEECVTKLYEAGYRKEDEVIRRVIFAIKSLFRNSINKDSINKRIDGWLGVRFFD